MFINYIEEIPSTTNVIIVESLKQIQ